MIPCNKKVNTYDSYIVDTTTVQIKCKVQYRYGIFSATSFSKRRGMNKA